MRAYWIRKEKQKFFLSRGWNAGEGSQNRRNRYCFLEKTIKIDDIEERNVSLQTKKKKKKKEKKIDFKFTDFTLSFENSKKRTLEKSLEADEGRW